MIIYTIKLQGVDHKLFESIIIEEEEIIISGKRMIKMYNNEFHILSYCTNVGMGRESMRESINLVIDSVLFEPDWIPEKPMPSLKKRCIKFKQDVRRHVYGR
jgi:hypothetical protein